MLIFDTRPINSKSIEIAMAAKDMTTLPAIINPMQLSRFLEKNDLMNESFFKKFNKKRWYCKRLTQEWDSSQSILIYKFTSDHFESRDLWFSIYTFLSHQNLSDFKKFALAFKGYILSNIHIFKSEVKDLFMLGLFFEDEDVIDMDEIRRELKRAYIQSKDLLSGVSTFEIEWIKRHPQDINIIDCSNTELLFEIAEIVPEHKEIIFKKLNAMYTFRYSNENVNKWFEIFPNDMYDIITYNKTTLDTIAAISLAKFKPEYAERLCDRFITKNDFHIWIREMGEDENISKEELYKKFNRLDPESFDKASRAAKYFMIQMNYDTLGNKARLSCKWRLFIMFMNYLSVKEFSEVLPNIKLWIEENGTRKDIWIIVNNLYNNEEIYIQNPKISRAVLKLMLYYIEKVNIRTAKTLLSDIIETESSNDDQNIFRMNVTSFITDNAKDKKIKKALFEIKLANR